MISPILSIGFSAMMRTFLSSFFCFYDEIPFQAAGFSSLAWQKEHGHRTGNQLETQVRLDKNRKGSFMRIGLRRQWDKLLFIAQPIVGRAHEPADPLR